MKRFGKVTLWIAGILLLLVMVLIGSLYLMSGKIKQTVLQEINKELSAKVAVGSINLTFFEHFPKVSLSFREVRMEESSTINDSALAVFDKVSLTMNVWNVLRQKIVVEGLEISKGYLSMAESGLGRTNYDVFKPSDDSVEKELGAFSFKQVRIKEVALYYKTPNELIELAIPELECKGNFISERFNATLKGQAMAAYNRSGRNLLAPRMLNFNSELTVDKKSELLRFSKTFIGLENLGFEVSGNWSFVGDGGELSVKTKNAEIKQLISLLPKQLATDVEDYESSGLLQLNGSIRQTGKAQPVIRADFAVEEGTLFLKEYGEGLSNIRFNGDILIAEKTEKINISRFEVYLGSDLIKGTFRLDGFDDPNLNAVVMGDLGLENLKRIANLGRYNKSSGRLSTNLNLQAKLSELKDPTKYRSIKLNGKIKGEDLNIGGDSLPELINNIDVFVEFQSASCLIHRFEADWNEDRIRMQGEAKNYLAFLFNEEDLNIVGRVKADRLNLTKAMSNANGIPLDSNALQLPPRVYVDAELMIGEFIAHEFRATKISGRAKLGGSRMALQQFQLETSEGKVKLSGDWTRKPDKFQVISLSADFSNINIQEAFRQFNNFGQQEILYSHIKGNLTGSIQVGMQLDPLFNPIMPSILAFVDFVILGGELNNYAPLRSLSRFVRIDDLEHIRFDRLENQFQIRNEIISIPAMIIKNSALNLVLEGQHSFSNVLNYSVQLQLKELMAARYIRNNPNDEFEAEEKGISLFLKMSGKPDKLSIRYDTRKARKEVKQEIKKEREQVRELIRKEFGFSGKGNENSNEERENLPHWEDDIPQ